MRITSALLFFALAIVTTNSFTQTKDFDPVPFFATINVGETYADSRMLIGSGHDVTFEDYIIDRASILAFTVHYKDTTSEDAWEMWFDFETGRYAIVTMERFRAFKPVESDSEFQEFVDWFEAVMTTKIREKVKHGERRIEWDYKADSEYGYMVRETKFGKGKRKGILVSLDRDAAH
ncbi:MAG: hypothetical protein CL946_02565 [Ectothiorhodospiraceae bacterium]|nr:hypothetical protein [Ectothiorhodospiraceae bacterium]